MNEEEKTQTNEEVSSDTTENTEENTGNGLSIVEEARQLKEENTRVLEEMKTVKGEMQEIAVHNSLGGSTSAGTAPEKPKPLTDEEFVAKFENGEVDLNLGK